MVNFGFIVDIFFVFVNFLLNGGNFRFESIYFGYDEVIGEREGVENYLIFKVIIKERKIKVKD